jgi:hypothetical protein
MMSAEAARPTRKEAWMTIAIELAPDVERRLIEAARDEGVAPADLASKVLADHLPQPKKLTAENDAMLALFDKWDEEDANMTPEEIEEENRSWEEFKRNINAERDRVGARRVF